MTKAHGERQIYSGKIIDVKAHLISGELVSEERFETSPKISLYMDDVFVVTVPAANTVYQSEDEQGNYTLAFEFKIGAPLRKRMPRNAKIRILIEGDESNPVTIPTPLARFSFGEATDGGAELKSMLAGNYEITHWGYLARTFGKNPELKEKFVEEYLSAREVVNSLDKELAFTGGNLLGLVRNNDFIPNDYDLDSGIYFEASTPEEAAEQYAQFVSRLIPAAKTRNIAVHAVNPGQLFLNSTKTDKDIYVDILFGWFQPDGFWYRLTSFGGHLGINRFEYRSVSFLGKEVVIPTHAESELIVTYGPDWREPKPIYRPNRKSEVLAMLKRFTDACSAQHARLFPSNN